MNLPEKVALPTDQELVLKVIPMPANCNAKGDIFGGWIMAQVDLAGAGGWNVYMRNLRSGLFAPYKLCELGICTVALVTGAH